MVIPQLESGFTVYEKSYVYTLLRVVKREIYHTHLDTVQDLFNPN